MDLTKQAIANIRLTCVQNRYYPVQQVDALLDDIAEAADRLQAETKQMRDQGGLSSAEQEELKRLREYERYARDEIKRLRDLVDTHDRSAYNSATMLKLAEQQSKDLVQHARIERDAIMQDAINKRERICAANRSAYYGALQFKQDLCQQFDELAIHLDAAMNALLAAENVQARLVDPGSEDKDASARALFNTPAGENDKEGNAVD